MGWGMRTIKLTVAYDGTNYNGFQRQKNALGIQQVLETGLTKIMGEDIWLVASGRTDTGVHAHGQVVSFTTASKVPAERIPIALKKQLPGDIVVTKAEEAPAFFHARYQAREKTYKYRIIVNTVSDPFIRNYAWEIKTPLNVEAMQQAADYLLGEHDFSAFRNAGSAPVSPVRRMRVAKWSSKSNKEYIFTIIGDGFLYHMVRNIVGTLVKVGQGRLEPQDFERILLSRQRSLAGMAAPPQGLYLEKVKY